MSSLNEEKKRVDSNKTDSKPDQEKENDDDAVTTEVMEKRSRGRLDSFAFISQPSNIGTTKGDGNIPTNKGNTMKHYCKTFQNVSDKFSKRDGWGFRTHCLKVRNILLQANQQTLRQLCTLKK